jgi:YebC/PmpR family DNA-binding regulatory protein
MSGHSKWAGIKHKKGALDAKRGKLFTKIIRELVIAAREKGGNPENNPRLRKAIETAREANMPADNIKKAIQRGTGELPGATYEEVVYEGYGPAKVAVIVEATTDNKNRTTSEMRKIFEHRGGSLGNAGCASYMFSTKGYITIAKTAASEDEVMSVALDAGADDVKTDDDSVFEVLTSQQNFETVKAALGAKFKLETAEVTMVPENYIKLTGKDAEQMLGLMDELEEHDDVKNVHANFDISAEDMERISAAQ